MKKLVIISYFYPPSAFVGGERTEFWARELHKYGYYPIIITRQWNNLQKDLLTTPRNNQLEIIRNENFEVHYLPHIPSTREKLNLKYLPSFLLRFITFFNIFLGFISTKFLPFKNSITYVSDLVMREKISGVLVSGRPFTTFTIARKIKKKTKIKWVADYRDEWTTSEVNYNSFLWKLIRFFENREERKCLKSATTFLTVNESIFQKTYKKFNKTGHVISNGFNFDQVKKPISKQGNELKLIYLGTLQPYQNIEAVFSLFYNLKDLPVKILFLGIESNPEMVKLIEKKSQEIPNITYHPNVSIKEVNEFCSNHDIGLSMNYNGYEHVVPVKAFKYFEQGLPILNFPGNPRSAQANFIKETNAGWVFKEPEINELENFIKSILIKKMNGEAISPAFNYANSKSYTREFQTEKLVNVLQLYFE